MPGIAARFVARTVILLTLVVGAISWISLDKSVTLVVDGQTRTVHTYSRSVAALLQHTKLHVGEHDTIAPSVDASLRDHSQIVLRRGRQVTLNIDNQPRTIWVTATSVQELFQQIGLRTNGAYLSASRSRPIGLDGLNLNIRMPHRVEIVVDGGAHTVITNAATVRDLLAAQRIVLAQTDKVSTPLGYYPTSGLVISITRVRGGVVSQSYPIAHDTSRVADPSRYVGNDYYSDFGVDGVLVRDYAVTFTNGVVTSRTLKSERVASKPRTAVLHYGTKPLPYQEQCQASWYGTGGDGYGAAHRTLPFGTRVRVEDIATGASVVVTINDRGPYVSGRCIDLDPEAFQQLASLHSGVIGVRLYYTV